MKKTLASALAATMLLSISSTAFASNELTMTTETTEGKYLVQLYDGKDNIQNTSIRDWKRLGLAAVDTEAQAEAAYVAYKAGYAKYLLALNQDKAVGNNSTAYLDAFVTAVKGNAATSPQALYKTFADLVSAEAHKTLDTPASVTEDDAIGYAKLPNTGTFESKIPVVRDVIWGGEGSYADNKSTANIVDQYKHYMYTYGTDDAKEVAFEVIVKSGDRLDIHIADGNDIVKVSKKAVEKSNTNAAGALFDSYKVVVKANAGVRQFDLKDWTIELDVGNGSTYFIKGKVAYSDQRELFDGDRLNNSKSNTDNSNNDGVIYNFANVVEDGKTRIMANDYVDVFFKGNYGTDKENMRVVTDEIAEVKALWNDSDVDYYDFIGTPKFASAVTVRVDGDKESFLYEYDKATGDITDITDEATYTSDGWTFQRKSLKTYLVAEEAYEGGNVNGEKEEPTKEPVESKPTTDSGKPNPGTGAYGA